MANGLNNLVAPLLHEAGIGMPEGPIDSEAFVRLYRVAADMLYARDAKNNGMNTASIRERIMMSRCMLSCLTLEEAIHCAEEFSAMIHPRLGVLTFQTKGTSAHFLIDPQRKNPDRCSCLVDVTGLLGLVQLFSWLIGENLRLRSVTLGYPHREDAAPLLALFGVPVSVGASVYALEFDSEQLSRPIMRRPEELGNFTNAFPGDLVGFHVHALPVHLRVQVYLGSALARGEPMPDLKTLAALIGGSVQNLRTGLSKEGTSYRALRETTLRQTAERYLTQTSLTVDQIVERLGFCDNLAFRRAFRHWTGLTPSQYRATAAEARH